MSIESIPSEVFTGNQRKAPRESRIPDKERRQVAHLLHLYGLSESHKAERTKPWPHVYKFYIGDQWGERPKWKASVTENHVFSKIETMLPILTDNRPRVEINPAEPQYMEYARLLQSRWDYVWRRQKLDRVVVQVTKNMLLYGKGFYYIYWDDEKQEIAVESVDPTNIFPDPDATSLEDARWVIHVANMSRDEIEAMWPDAEKKLSEGSRMVKDPSAWRDEIRESDRSDERWRVGREYAETAGDSSSNMTAWVKASHGKGKSGDDMIQVMQFWIRDDEVMEEPWIDDETGIQFEDEEDGSPLYRQVPKYPGGRHIVMASGRIIHDDKNPFDHGKFPYVEQDCHAMPGEFWPVGAGQNLLPLQKHLNKVNSQIIDNIALMGNGQWLVSRDSGITADTITARPGEVVTKNTPQSYAERLQAPTLPAYISQMADALRAAMDNVSGVFDVTQGRKPSGITAGVAIEQLQEAGHTRIRLLVRNLELAVSGVGEQGVALFQQFYTEPRTVRMTDPETGEEEFYQLTPEMIAGAWEVEVAAGSTLPRSRDVRQREAIELYKLQIFDEEAALEHIDHPGRQALLRRIKERKQMEMMMAMMSGEAGASPGGGQMQAIQGAGGPPSLGGE